MKRIIIILSLVALMAAACGTSDVGTAGTVSLPPDADADDTTTPTTQPPADDDSATSVTTTTTTAPDDEPDNPDDPAEPVEQAFVKVYYVHDGLTARYVIRSVDTPGVASGAIQALIDGPNVTEQGDNLFSAIPADTLLLSLTIEDGLATIDLSREFEAGGGTFSVLSRLAQVVYTLTEFDTVDDVLFHLDGQPVDVFSGEGVILDGPVDRDDYATILPLDQDPEADLTDPWGQIEMPDVSDADASVLFQVDVAEDDFLNVRQDPTVEAAIVGRLLPGVVVERTGEQAIVGSSLWVRIDTPAGEFWVNNQFLAPVS